MSVSTIYWLCCFLYMGLIFIASSIPGERLPKIDIYFLDKIIHLLEFGILSWLFGKAFRTSNKKIFIKQAAILSIILTILYGISDEIHQFYVPSRSPDIYDVVFNSIGAILAQGIFFKKDTAK